MTTRIVPCSSADTERVALASATWGKTIALALGTRSCSKRSAACNIGSDSKRRCIGLSSSRYARRQQAHPLVMGHELPDGNVARSPRHPRGRKVDGFVEAIAPR